MPTFEFKCKQCGHEFEELVRGEERVKCPKCDSKELKKLISRVNVGSGSSNCEEGTCSCNSCGL